MKEEMEWIWSLPGCLCPNNIVSWNTCHKSVRFMTGTRHFNYIGRYLLFWRKGRKWK